jgi:hypothetical protein
MSIPNLRKLKYIEKAAQRDWARRYEIRAAGLRALGFYSEPFLYPWVNPVKILYGMLLQVKPKRRAAIFRLGRAALKQNALVKIQSLGNPHWLDLKKMDAAANFESEFKSGDLRKLKFSTPEQDKVGNDIDRIVKFIQDNVAKLEPEEKWKVLEAVYNWVGQQEV